MVDRLERQILEIIGNASSLVRTVTQKEIQAGVLFPSLTAIDIKRHLPSEISLSLIDSRLNLLERDGYIFRENSRWWLTRKGRKEIGLPEDREPKVEESGKPVSRIIEEAFARHGVGEGGEMEGQEQPDNRVIPQVG